MSYIPDCRKDDTYNQKYLSDSDKNFIGGYDFCTEHAIDNAFANLDTWEHDDLDVRPSDITKVAEALKPFLLEWIERDRDELITSMIDSMDNEEYQRIKARVDAEEAQAVKDTECV